MHTLGRHRQAAQLRLDEHPRVVVVRQANITSQPVRSTSMVPTRQNRCAARSAERAAGSSATSGGSPGQFVHSLSTGHGIDILAEGNSLPVSAARAAAARGSTPSSAATSTTSTPISSSSASAPGPDVILAQKDRARAQQTGGDWPPDGAFRRSARHLRRGGMPVPTASCAAAGVRIEHEEVAAAQGRHAARAMLGSDEPYARDPVLLVRPRRLGDARVRRRRADAGTRRSSAATRRAGAFSVFYVARRAASSAALAVGRGDDLDVARELIAAGGGVNELPDA